MYLRFNSGMEDLMKYNKNASNSLFSERSAKNKVLIIVPHVYDVYMYVHVAVCK